MVDHHYTAELKIKKFKFSAGTKNSAENDFIN